MDQFFSDAVEEYVINTFTPEMAGEIRGSMMVFDAFEYPVFDQEVADIVYYDDDVPSDEVQLQFTACLHKHLNSILRQHRVRLNSDADVRVKNQILGVLYRLQHLEDPVPVLRILESSLSPEEQFAKIVSIYGQVTETDVLVALESLDEVMLSTLQAYLYEQENKDNEVIVSPAKAKMVENLKDFYHCHGTDNLGYEMMENGIVIGHPLSLYYPYIKDNIVTPDDKQTAENILSFFYIAEDTWLDPMKVYRASSEKLIGDTSRIVKIETIIADMLNALTQYQKAKDDARKLSVVQHQAQVLS